MSHWPPSSKPGARRISKLSRYEAIAEWLRAMDGTYSSKRPYGVTAALTELMYRKWPNARHEGTYMVHVLRDMELDGLITIARDGLGTPKSITLIDAEPATLHPTSVGPLPAASSFAPPKPIGDIDTRLNTAYRRIADLEAQMVQAARKVDKLETWAKLVATELGMKGPA